MATSLVRFQHARAGGWRRGSDQTGTQSALRSREADLSRLPPDADKPQFSQWTRDGIDDLLWVDRVSDRAAAARVALAGAGGAKWSGPDRADWLQPHLSGSTLSK